MVDTNVDYYNATPLPPGLTINTNFGQSGFILGTPTAAGVYYPVTLTAGNEYYDQDGGAPIHTNITITIATSSGNYAPSFTSQPQSATVTNGGRASFSASVIGSPAPAYQWRKNGANMSGATAATYTIASATTNDVAAYTLMASNSSGSTTSQLARLYVVQVPRFTNFVLRGEKITLGFNREAGAVYDVLASSFIPSSNWLTLTNLPAVPSNSPVSLTNSVTNSASQFYRLRMTLP